MEFISVHIIPILRLLNSLVNLWSCRATRHGRWL